MGHIMFRAWDKENEAMVYPKGILFDGRVVYFSCGTLDVVRYQDGGFKLAGEGMFSTLEQ